MARKAGGAIQRLLRQSSPKTHLPHSRLSGLLGAKDTQPVTHLHHDSLLHPILHPPGISQVPLHRYFKPSALAPASKASLAVSSERQTPFFSQRSLISAARTFERPIVVPKWVLFISEHFYISPWDYYPFLLWLFQKKMFQANRPVNDKMNF